jgi:NAD(P)-dependent dehydrogenase (short-subunit alcohol dehydrogenase family)
MARSPLQTLIGPRYGVDKTGEELLALVASSIHIGRIAGPEEIANIVCFLLSDLSSYITGQAIHASGGSLP